MKNELLLATLMLLNTASGLPTASKPENTTQNRTEQIQSSKELGKLVDSELLEVDPKNWTVH